MLNYQFSLPYISLLNYATKGQCNNSIESRKIVENYLKKDKANVIHKVVDRVVENFVEGGSFVNYFDKKVCLVPVPSSVKKVTGALHVPLRICEELRLRNLGLEVVELVERTKTIRSSRFSASGNRPNIEMHLDSMALIPTKLPDEVSHILLVDDVVSIGRSFIASAIILREKFPNMPIKAFAVARTLGRVSSIDKIRDPYEGTINFNGRDADRS